MKNLYFKLLLLLIFPCCIFLSACDSSDIFTLTTESIYAMVQEKGYTGTIEDFLKDISGEDGENGLGIKSIIKTYTNGLVDTYTITFTDNSTTTFDVKNGANGVGIISAQINKDDELILILSDNTTINAGCITSVKVESGLSAYEIYIQYYPDYNKTEQEWILDLVNGNLSEKSTYTVTFDSNGGTAIDPQSGIEFAHKATKPADPTKDGYRFDGWYYLDEKWSFIGYSVTEDITLTAHWCLETYEINYALNGGSVSEALTNNYTVESAEILLPKPTKIGYQFLGWFNNAAFEGEAITKISAGSSGNINLYAKWGCVFNFEQGCILGFSEYWQNESSYIIIPRTLDGEIVESIANNAFVQRELEYIVIDTNIVELGENVVSSDCAIYYLGDLNTFQELMSEHINENFYIYAETDEDLNHEYQYWHYNSSNEPEPW